VIYDPERNEIVCQGCGLVLDVGSEKPEAISLLSLQPVIPRKLLVELCDLYAKKKAAQEHVEVTYTPEIQRLEHRITGIPGRTCDRCGVPILRKGTHGRLPDYCSRPSCVKERQRESSKNSREKQQHENPQDWKKKRAKWRKNGRDRRRQTQIGTKSGEDLGGRPLTTLDLQQIGISKMPHIGEDEQDAK
jgi:ssDNA-binding Zn-finger/Zn-ribbon topoisomerase 1